MKALETDQQGSFVVCPPPTHGFRVFEGPEYPRFSSDAAAARKAMTRGEIVLEWNKYEREGKSRKGVAAGWREIQPTVDQERRVVRNEIRQVGQERLDVPLAAD